METLAVKSMRYILQATYTCYVHLFVHGHPSYRHSLQHLLSTVLSSLVGQCSKEPKISISEFMKCLEHVESLKHLTTSSVQNEAVPEDLLSSKSVIGHDLFH